MGERLRDEEALTKKKPRAAKREFAAVPEEPEELPASAIEELPDDISTPTESAPKSKLEKLAAFMVRERMSVASAEQVVTDLQARLDELNAELNKALESNPKDPIKTMQREAIIDDRTRMIDLIHAQLVIAQKQAE